MDDNGIRLAMGWWYIMGLGGIINLIERAIKDGLVLSPAQIDDLHSKVIRLAGVVSSERARGTASRD